MLILALVCVAWLEIIGIQSARKEARRREAVERLAGMMDAFMYVHKDNEGWELIGCYAMDPDDDDLFKPVGQSESQAFNPDLAPIGYRLRVVENPAWPRQSMIVDWSPHSWLIGQLYDKTGRVDDKDKPFFTLQACLGYY